VKRKVVFSPEAQADLLALYDYIADQASATTALRYVTRIERYCLGFDIAPERGTRRDDLRPGLRTIGFERRATIAFHVEGRTVTIDRILYGGRSLERTFHEEE
jgi:toxin ParE1/3/4